MGQSLRGANILLAPLVRGGGGRARTVHFHVEFPVLLAQRAAELGVLDVDLDGVIHGPGDVTHGGVRGSRARGCGKAITPIKVFKFSKKLMRSVGRSGTFRSDIRVSVVCTTLSERVRTRRALTTPRGRDTLGRSRTSGESSTSQPRPARVVSGPPRAHATRPPTLRTLLVFRTKKRILRIVRAEESV